MIEIGIINATILFIMIKLLDIIAASRQKNRTGFSKNLGLW